MSRLLRARQNPPFAWQYKWTRLNEDGTKKIDIDSAFKQPERVTVKWDVKEQGTGARGRTRQVLADIVPDKGVLGPEFALIYTIPGFESKIRPHLDVTGNNYVTRLHNLFGKCIQGEASTK